MPRWSAGHNLRGYAEPIPRFVALDVNPCIDSKHGICGSLCAQAHAQNLRRKDVWGAFVFLSIKNLVLPVGRILVNQYPVFIINLENTLGAF
jgi:hypothetical protein